MKKQKLKPEDYVIRWRPSSIPGTLAAELCQIYSPQPIGSVWYRHGCTKDVIEILDSYVPEHSRRQGIRTAIHNEMLSWYPETRIVITKQGTKLSTPWLKRIGFKKIRDAGSKETYWRLEVKK